MLVTYIYCKVNIKGGQVDYKIASMGWACSWLSLVIFVCYHKLHAVVFFNEQASHRICNDCCIMSEEVNNYLVWFQLFHTFF